MRSAVLIIIATICFAPSLFGQDLHPVFGSSKTGHSLGVYVNAGLASNSIHPKFVSDLYTGQALDRGMREGQLRLMGNTNRVGGDLDYGLFYRHTPDSIGAGIGWFLNISSHTNANLAFTNDLYELTFLGNAGFAGETADLDLKFQFWDYKKYGGGLIIDKQLNKAKLRIGLGINFLMINRHAKGQFTDTELFTQEFGEYLDVSAKGEVFTSGLGSGGYFNYAGYGFSGDLIAQIAWPKHTLSFQVLDLGGATLERDHSHYAIDSSYRYEGIDINLFASEGEPFSNIQLDSLQERLGLSSFGGMSYSSLLPSIFHVRTEHLMGQGKWTLFGGVQYRLAAYFPLMYVGANFQLPAKFKVQPAFAWGGYGSWNVGLELSKEFGDLASLAIGTRNLEGLILPSIGTGQGAYAKLEFHF